MLLHVFIQTECALSCPSADYYPNLTHSVCMNSCGCIIHYINPDDEDSL
jgi:hypothetical protein